MSGRRHVPLPLSTRGRAIVDATGRRVKLACVNWYGAHMELFAVGGLHLRPLDVIAANISTFGFNCVRLTLSVELVLRDPPVPPAAVAANPQLVGLSALPLLDHVVSALARHGVLTILNNHNSENGWCCEPGSPEGLWWTDSWPVDAWLDAIARLAARYRNGTSSGVVPLAGSKC